MLRATLGEPAPIQIQVNTAQTDLYARVKVYDISGALTTTLDLTHVAEGLYASTYIFVSPGYYTAVYQLYTDAGYSILSNFGVQAEQIEANSDKTNITRLLGLTHDNVVIDSQSYNSEGALLTSRVRQYDTAANALLAGATGLLNTWNIVATYTLTGTLADYKMTRA